MLIPRERDSGEQRVAATPETVRRLISKGLNLQVEQGAGEAAGYADADFAAADDQLVLGGVVVTMAVVQLLPVFPY